MSGSRRLAQEGIEWCEDWKAGQFAPAPTPDGWTVEMHGLVDSHEKACRYVMALRGHLAVIAGSEYFGTAEQYAQIALEDGS